jgi:hypothetical protein
MNKDDDLWKAGLLNLSVCYANAGHPDCLTLNAPLKGLPAAKAWMGSVRTAIPLSSLAYGTTAPSPFLSIRGNRCVVTT